MDERSERMCEAAKRGDKEAVRALLALGCNVNYKSWWHESTALIDAARHGHGDVVTLLLDYGARIEAVDKEGRTAFICASMFGNRECMYILHKRGARIGAKDKYKMRALDYAVMYKNVVATEWLLAAMGLDHEEYVPGAHTDQPEVEDAS